MTESNERNMTRPPLRRLVARAANRDSHALSDIYRLTSRDVLYTAHKLLDHASDASDAALETFLRAFRDIDRLRDPAVFPIWLSRLLLCFCKSMSRRPCGTDGDIFPSERPADIPDNPTAFPPDTAVDRRENARRILAIIESLPFDQKTVVLLFCYQRMSPRETALVMDIPIQAVHALLQRARASVHKHFVEDVRNRGPLEAAAVASLITNALTEDAASLITPDMVDRLWIRMVPKLDMLTPSATPPKAVGGAGLFAAKVSVAVLLSAAVITGSYGLSRAFTDPVASAQVYRVPLSASPAAPLDRPLPSPAPVSTEVSLTPIPSPLEPPLAGDSAPGLSKTPNTPLADDPSDTPVPDDTVSDAPDPPPGN